MAILSPFRADTVTISRCISVGSCTFNTYPELDDVIRIGGVLESGGVRLARAVGDGMDDADELEDWESHCDITGHMTGSVCREASRLQDDKPGKPGLLWLGNTDKGCADMAFVLAAMVGEIGRGLEISKSGMVTV
jgi:hypothetical protein